MSDLYKILDVKPDATQVEIKSAFRAMSQLYHPDKNTDEGATELFTSINKAYTILKDPVKRKMYDETGDTKTVDLIGKARGAIASMLKTFIDRSIDENAQPPKIPDVISEYESQIRSYKKESYRLKSKLKKLEKMNDRIKIKDHDDLYRQVHDSVVEALTNEFKVVKENIEVGELIIKILDGAEDTGLDVRSLSHYVSTSSIYGGSNL